MGLVKTKPAITVDGMLEELEDKKTVDFERMHTSKEYHG